MNVWPPFLFAGIRVLEISDDWRRARVALRHHWYNRNYVGTHFGGSLFAMTDPFWMVLMLNRLGGGYIVWDKAAEIEFVEATKEPVYAEFRLDDDTVAETRAATTDGSKYLRGFETDVRTAQGDLVARVRKQLYVRRTITRSLRPAPHRDPDPRHAPTPRSHQRGPPVGFFLREPPLLPDAATAYAA